MKVIIFDIWGDYGHFRKFYTTSSPLTFSFPPPSTIAGIIGAIYGADKNEYIEKFSSDNCSIAIKIVKPVKKVRIGLNLINTKGNYWIPFGNKNHEPRTQIRTEFLKNPYFRIYISHKDLEVQQKLINLLKEHKSIYTVSMGLSELLANCKYIGMYEAEKICNGNHVDISTPIVVSKIISEGFEVESGKKYFREKIPLIMKPDRVIEKYDDVIFESEGKTIKAKLTNYYKIEDGENIAFF